ncbi:trypsin inhibitor ClTI-1-like isoform X2 [Rhincodon typus]|uniref:trypsin inhibitor ClTI-1-like isoform X2 n=1 Tax=Rhincodon typus TaxID=259920 RepID=UPI0009A30E68|nr:trypsin inhibitor ClTI-1-like isoform X2 [Rhincodon typus]
MKMNQLFLITTSLLFIAADQLGAAIELKCDDYPKLPDCPSRYVPLCGTNGKDYLNPCYLCRHNKKTREDVAILHEGFCTCQDMKIN